MSRSKSNILQCLKMDLCAFLSEEGADMTQYPKYGPKHKCIAWVDTLLGTSKASLTGFHVDPRYGVRDVWDLQMDRGDLQVRPFSRYFCGNALARGKKLITLHTDDIYDMNFMRLLCRYFVSIVRNNANFPDELFIDNNGCDRCACSVRASLVLGKKHRRCRAAQ